MSEWIEWNGGERPVPAGADVSVRFRSGTEHRDMSPQSWMWNNWTGKSNHEIVAYKVHTHEIDPNFAAAHYGHDLKVGDGHDALTFHALPVIDAGDRPGDGPPIGSCEAARPVYDAGGVGDIGSTAKGSGARFNGGKTPIDLVPLRQVGNMYIMNGGLTRYQMNAARALQFIGDYQARARGVEALYDAMLALAADDIEQAWKECCDVFDYGRKKYAAWNWSKGMAWSIPIACAGRHIVWGILDGEVDDPESGKPHRGHVFCNLVMLIAYETCFQEGDDRPAAGMIGAAPAANDEAQQAAA